MASTLRVADVRAFPLCSGTVAPYSRTLIIEDDRDIVELVRYNLEKDGFRIAACGDGLTGLAQIRKSPPDLLIFGSYVAEAFRARNLQGNPRSEKFGRLPILMLTALGEEADRVVGLELGADDYVAKPFSPRELAARVTALLRCAQPAGGEAKLLEVDDLRVDPFAYRAQRAGKTLPLSTLEFRLLYYLASRPNRVLSRDQLLDAVWGSNRFVTPRSVDVYVRRLREKVEKNPEKPK